MKAISFFILPALLLIVACQNSTSQSKVAIIERDTLRVQPKLTVENLGPLVERWEKEENSLLLIDGPANIRAKANGKLMDELPDLHPVTLLMIEGKWAKIQYSLNQNQKTGWTHLQNLPHSCLLGIPSKVLEANSEFLKIEIDTSKEIGEEDYVSLSFSIGYNNSLILSTWINPDTYYKSPTYALAYTGLKEFPFLLYYSGQTGDMINVEGQLILFHPDGTILEFTHYQPGQSNG